MGLGGAMIWSLDLDDFSGKFCRNGRYPLLNEINSEFKGIHKVKTGVSEPTMGLIHGSWKSLDAGLGTSQPDGSSLQRQGSITLESAGLDTGLLEPGVSLQQGGDRLVISGASIEGQGTGAQTGTLQGMLQGGMQIDGTSGIMQTRTLGSQEAGGKPVDIIGIQTGLRQGMFQTGMQTDGQMGMSPMSMETGLQGSQIVAGSTMGGLHSETQTGTDQGMFQGRMHIDGLGGTITPSADTALQGGKIVGGSSIDGQVSGSQTKIGQDMFQGGMRIDSTGGTLAQTVDTGFQDSQIVGGSTMDGLGMQGTFPGEMQLDGSGGMLPAQVDTGVQGSQITGGSTIEGQITGSQTGLGPEIFQGGMRIDGTGETMTHTTGTGLKGSQMNDLTIDGLGMQGTFQRGMQLDGSGGMMPAQVDTGVQGSQITGGSTIEGQITGSQTGLGPEIFQGGMRIDGTGETMTHTTGTGLKGSQINDLTIDGLGMQGTFQRGMQLDGSGGMLPAQVDTGVQGSQITGGSTIEGQITGSQTGLGPEIFQGGMRIDGTGETMTHTTGTGLKGSQMNDLTIDGLGMQGMFQRGMQLDGSGGMMPAQVDTAVRGSEITGGSAVDGQDTMSQIGMTQGMVERMTPTVDTGFQGSQIVGGSAMEGQITRLHAGTGPEILQGDMRLGGAGGMMPETVVTGQEGIKVTGVSAVDGQGTVFQVGMRQGMVEPMTPAVDTGLQGSQIVGGSAMEGQITRFQTGTEPAMFQAGTQIDGSSVMMPETVVTGQEGIQVAVGSAMDGVGTTPDAGTAQGLVLSGTRIHSSGVTMPEKVVTGLEGIKTVGGSAIDGIATSPETGTGQKMFQAGMRMDSTGRTIPELVETGIHGSQQVGASSFDGLGTVDGLGTGSISGTMKETLQAGMGIDRPSGVTTGTSFASDITNKGITGSQSGIIDGMFEGGIVHQSGVFESPSTQSGFSDGSLISSRAGVDGQMIDSGFADGSMSGMQTGTSSGIFDSGRIIGDTVNVVGRISDAGSVKRPIIVEQTGKPVETVAGGGVDGATFGARAGGKIFETGITDGSSAGASQQTIGGIFESGTVLADMSGSNQGTFDGTFESGIFDAPFAGSQREAPVGSTETGTLSGTLMRKQTTGTQGGILDSGFVDGSVAGTQTDASGGIFDRGVIDGRIIGDKTGASGQVLETGTMDGAQMKQTGGVFDIGVLDGSALGAQTAKGDIMVDRGNVGGILTDQKSGPIDVSGRPLPSSQPGIPSESHAGVTIGKAIITDQPRTAGGTFDTGMVDGQALDAQQGSVGIFKSGTVGGTFSGFQETLGSTTFDNVVSDRPILAPQSGIVDGAFATSKVEGAITDSQARTPIDIPLVNIVAEVKGTVQGAVEGVGPFRGTFTAKAFEDGMVQGTTEGSAAEGGTFNGDIFSTWVKSPETGDLSFKGMATGEVIQLGNKIGDFKGSIIEGKASVDGPVTGTLEGTGPQGARLTGTLMGTLVPTLSGKIFFRNLVGKLPHERITGDQTQTGIPFGETGAVGNRIHIDTFETGTPRDASKVGAAFDRSVTTRTKVDIPTGWAFETGKSTDLQASTSTGADQHATASFVGLDTALGATGTEGAMSSTDLGGIGRSTDFGNVVHGSFVVEPVKDSSVNLIERDRMDMGSTGGIQTGQTGVAGGFGSAISGISGLAADVKVQSHDVPFMDTRPITTDIHAEVVKKDGVQTGMDGSMSGFLNEAGSVIAGSEPGISAGTSGDIMFQGQGIDVRGHSQPIEGTGAEFGISGIQIVKSNRMQQETGVPSLQTTGGFKATGLHEQTVADSSFGLNKIAGPVESKIFQSGFNEGLGSQLKAGNKVVKSDVTGFGDHRMTSDSLFKVSQPKSTVSSSTIRVGQMGGQSTDGMTFDQGGMVGSGAERKVISTYKLHEPVTSPLFSWLGTAPPPGSEEIGLYNGGNIMSDLSMDRTETKYIQPIIKSKSTVTEWKVTPRRVISPGTSGTIGSQGFRAFKDMQLSGSASERTGADSQVGNLNAGGLSGIKVQSGRVGTQIQTDGGRTVANLQTSGMKGIGEGAFDIGSMRGISKGAFDIGSFREINPDTVKVASSQIRTGRLEPSGGSMTDFITGNTEFGGTGSKLTELNMVKQVKVDQPNVIIAASKMDKSIEPHVGQFPGQRQFESGIFSSLNTGQLDIVPGDASVSQLEPGAAMGTSGVASTDTSFSTGEGRIKVGGSVSSSGRNDIMFQGAMQSGGDAFLSNMPMDSGAQVVGGQSAAMQGDSVGGSNVVDMPFDASGIISKEGFITTGGVGNTVTASVASSSKNAKMFKGEKQTAGDAFLTDVPFDSGIKVVGGQAEFMKTDSFGASNIVDMPRDASGMISNEGLFTTGGGGNEVVGSFAASSKNAKIVQGTTQSGADAFLTDLPLDRGIKVVGGQAKVMKTDSVGSFNTHEMPIDPSAMAAKSGFISSGETGMRVDGSVTSSASDGMMFPSQSGAVQGGEMNFITANQRSMPPISQTGGMEVSVEGAGIVENMPTTFQNELTKQVSGQADIGGMMSHESSLNMAHTGQGQFAVQSDKPVVMRTESLSVDMPQVADMVSQTEMGPTADHRTFVIDNPFQQSHFTDQQFQGDGAIISSGQVQAPGERAAMSGSFEVSGIMSANQQGEGMMKPDTVTHAGQGNMNALGFTQVADSLRQRQSGSLSGSSNTLATGPAVSIDGKTTSGGFIALDNQLTSSANTGTRGQNQGITSSSHGTGADQMLFTHGSEGVSANLIGTSIADGSISQPAKVSGLTFSRGHFILDPIVPFRENLVRSNRINGQIMGLNHGGTASSENLLSTAAREFAPSGASLRRERITVLGNSNSQINQANTRQWSRSGTKLTNVLGTNHLNSINTRAGPIETRAQQIDSTSEKNMPIS